MTIDPTINMRPAARRAALSLAAASGGSAPVFTLFGYNGFRVIDQAAIIAWYASITFYTPLSGLILYACCGYYFASTLIHLRTFSPALLRCWPMFIIPTLAFISSLWAPSASEAIRKSLLFYMTGIVAIYYAQRLTARQILYTIFVVHFFAGVASAIQPDYVGSAATGIYDQKNMLAINMFYLYGPSLLLLRDKEAPVILRLMAILGAPIALYLIFISQSMTTLVLTLLATAGLIVHEIIWRPAQKVAHLRTTISLAFGVMMIAASFILFAVVQGDYYGMFLDALGKDATLTGRTVIWDAGRRVMEEHPWTGVGIGGFWRPEIGAANSLLTYVHLEQFTAITFHNSYIDNGVMAGYPGYYGTIFVAAWCVLQAARNWFSKQTMFNFYFLLVALLTVLRSNGESDFGVEFGAVMIFIAAARMGAPQPEARDLPQASKPVFAQFQPLRGRARAAAGKPRDKAQP
jgi:exopolysaccharide production protein ExoQ